jgi:hypothetical protein
VQSDFCDYFFCARSRVKNIFIGIWRHIALSMTVVDSLDGRISSSFNRQATTREPTRGAEVLRVQPRDTTMTISSQGHQLRFRPDGSLENHYGSDARPPAAFATPSPATFTRTDNEIPEAFRELADTIAMLATACFDATDPADAPAMMDPDETVDCDDQSDQELDDGGPEGTGSGAAESSDGTIAAAAASTTEYSLRIMEATCINTNAVVAFASALLRAKSLSELVVITTAHARRQIETVADQTKQLVAAAHKMAPKKSSAVDVD